MYRWQTLTLARVEAKASEHKVSGLQYRAVRQVLFDIGIRSFLEPDVTNSNKCVVLAWNVDDRTFRATVEWDGKVKLNTFGEGLATFDDSEAGYTIADRVHFLLFGRFPVSSKGPTYLDGVKAE